jgi:hypothetical protein
MISNQDRSDDSRRSTGWIRWLDSEGLAGVGHKLGNQQFSLLSNR